MKVFISFLFLFFTFSSIGQTNNFDANLNKYSDDYMSERLYMHFDKSDYAKGETIWFKAYLMKAIFPATESKTLYVDWTDEQGKLLLRTTSPMLEAASVGQFEIPEDYKGRFLHVKAYTRWMLNFDSTFLFNKDIRILDSKNTAAATKVNVIPEINFFPEGGYIISGINNKVAFKANDQGGKPVKISGVVKNKKGVIMDSLRLVHDGMGYFFVNPAPGESYTAIWKDANKKEYTTHLPEIKASGVSIAVGILNNSRSFLISSSANSDNSSTFHVLGTMYQQPVFKLDKALKDGKIQGIIPTQALPSGLLTITVFDEKMKPLAERVTYINNEEYLFTPELEVQHWGLNKRARNEIMVSVPDSISANLSISVTDLGIGNHEEDNIISHLLLTSELKGKVNNPAYYFQNNSDSLTKELDLVMLTNGWRRFNWENVANGTFPEITFPRDTSYLSISGKIFGISPVQMKSAGDIIILFNQAKKGNQVFTVPITKEGTFNDPSLILFDTARIYYQLPKLKGSGSATVQFMQNRLTALSNTTKAGGWLIPRTNTESDSYHLKLSDATLRELTLQKGKILETVNIEAKTKPTIQAMDEKYASGLFSGGDGYQFDLLNDRTAMGSRSIFDYLQGKVPGLQITGNPPTLSWRNQKPALFLNEMPTDVSMISDLSVADIAYVKVMRPPFMGAVGGGAGGAISIYMRRGGDIEAKPGDGLANNVVTGYTAIREFYSPNYDVISKENEGPDSRTTLFWAPEIVLRPGANNVVFTFFNNDVTKGFKVVIEGMTKDGKLAHFEQILE